MEPAIEMGRHICSCLHVSRHSSPAAVIVAQVGGVHVELSLDAYDFSYAAQDKLG